MSFVKDLAQDLDEVLWLKSSTAIAGKENAPDFLVQIMTNAVAKKQAEIRRDRNSHGDRGVRR